MQSWGANKPIHKDSVLGSRICQGSLLEERQTIMSLGLRSSTRGKGNVGEGRVRLEALSELRKGKAAPVFWLCLRQSRKPGGGGRRAAHQPWIPGSRDQ